MELEKFIVIESDSIEQAIQMIEINSSRCVVVTNIQNRVVGVLSEGDILRAILKGINTKSPVKNILNPGFKFLIEMDEEKLINYIKQGITLVPVLNENRELINVINVIKFLCDKFKL